MISFASVSLKINLSSATRSSIAAPIGFSTFLTTANA